MKRISKISWLVMIAVLFGMLNLVNAQTEEENLPPIEKWETISDVNLTLGFVKGWDSDGGAASAAGVAPGGKIRIHAYISQHNSFDEIRGALQSEFSSWCNDVEMDESVLPDEINGLQVFSMNGKGKLKDDGSAVDIFVDFIEVKGKIVVLAAYGFHEGMEEHFNEYMATRNSVKAAE